MMFEPGAGFEPADIGFADRRVSHFTIRADAETERFELSTPEVGVPP